MAAYYIETMEAKVKRADAYLKLKNYDVVHQHGQRISTNQWVDAQQAQRAQWNEIFIGKLPRDLFEDELLPLLEQIGLVYKIRYMMDFSGSNRGFCFVKYTTREEAIQATKLLDGIQLRPDKPPIGVQMSFDNKCLFFGNLPAECTGDKLVKALERAEVKGIVRAQMAGGHGTPNKCSKSNNNNFKDVGSTRFCYVYFESHDAATKARRLLLPGDVRLFNRKLTLDWAKSEIPSDVLALRSNNNNNRDINNETNQRQVTRTTVPGVANFWPR